MKKIIYLLVSIAVVVVTLVGVNLYDKTVEDRLASQINPEVATRAVSDTSSKDPVVEPVSRETDKIVTTQDITDDDKITQETTYTQYVGLGIEISYPDDGTYFIELSDDEDTAFRITQEHPGNRIHVEKLKDASSYPEPTQKKTINGVTYDVFYYEGMGDGYGYLNKVGDSVYVFTSIWGPENEVFESIMKSVKYL